MVESPHSQVKEAETTNFFLFNPIVFKKRRSVQVRPTEKTAGTDGEVGPGHPAPVLWPLSARRGNRSNTRRVHGALGRLQRPLPTHPLGTDGIQDGVLLCPSVHCTMWPAQFSQVLDILTLRDFLPR